MQISGTRIVAADRQVVWSHRNDAGTPSAAIPGCEVPEGTELSCDADAALGGKLAQLGSRRVGGTVRKLTGQFFDAFGDHVEAPALGGVG